MSKINYYALGIMAAVVSFLGFIVENVWLAITEGYINNRNMHAPFLIGYGMLILAIYLVLGTPDKVILFRKYEKKTTKVKSYLLYFVLAFVVVCVAEIVLGTIVEKVCHINYWNYSWLPLHITKYTSVPTSFLFASLITFFMGVIFQPLMTLILKINPKVMKVLSIVLVVVMLVDYLYSFYWMIKKKDFLLKWKFVFRK